MEVEWITKSYGRESDLRRLNRLRNSDKIGPLTRLGHDKAHSKIESQLRDKTYTGLRERLIRATLAGDHTAVRKIELQIRDYLGEEKMAFTLDDD